MATIEAMIVKQAQSRDTIITQLLKLLFGLWNGYSSWDDVDLVAGMAARSASIVDGANQKSRLLTRAFHTSVLKQLDHDTKPMPALLNAYPRANITPSEVYQRPVEQFIWARRNGLSFLDSKDAFDSRLTDIATQDVKLADRDEANRVFEAQGIGRWRRVIHPELSKSGTCGLCIVASQRVYTTGDLMSMHGPSCNCTPLEITTKSDPGLRINDDDLKTIYAAAGSTAAADLQNTRITVNEHGELGPVLTKHGDHFRTAAEAGRPAYVKPTNANIRATNEQERTDLVASVAQAQARYDAAAASGTQAPDQVPLFRSIKYMNERIASIDGFLKKLPK